ncbi:bifunctional D-glycero-beta-D-manno-heptose-7-phosphate kinase/D-glycero-beta-D-manno-heptose 1-phosphate adenylyltransferase HldE [Thiohalobacter sp. IOR34]|uniref:bifunctional D-glycero-beta-D-manno-heptose-7-phosphate kinase/D-glycero-beta-D-manno-heptose 1-phosphate adenylyltransferase HldE n=1 Tax=Thiohalobacter sp. IOR34 TaxID=3057176 RepID=UPI0025B025A3|nr:bifunctional D-glycero-beta-D-manno-heptose-7-phosphate kinase/D-glycero-beta-D-manno-heptose 1-phosphate adenylyltransferase HldE [Thiohalobacter sp. IOR34]WJW75263.1 bifunctional D-glycero-beta-D-manno-heptose-7-phosphate kinase/D-glycero-beta-D-manno-heptose 1-phosphate adenylyltransferase HldE [Thiohalobacter sp. IOR34]
MIPQIPAFDQARVLVVGDVMLDRYWHGSTSRISPEAPVPVVHIGSSEERPGGAGNVALNIAALQAQAVVLGLTGDDEAADSLTRALQSAGVECRLQRLAGAPTVTKLRIISRHQQLIRLDFETGFEDVDPAPLLSSYGEALPDCGAVVISDYGKGALRPLRELIEAARAAGRPVLVDPKRNDFSVYADASLITPNLAEFEAVVGPCRSEEELVEKGLELIRRHRLEALLVTRGEQGMTLLREGHPEFHLPAEAREVFDVTGAGDTVIAVLAACLAAGSDLQHATALANVAAGIVVGKLGTAAASIPEIRRVLAMQHAAGSGVLSEEQLAVAVADARAHGERIVMTNGCFDILHAGHVSYLAEARRLGDRLIVAVNDDASVRRLKGEGRPINPLERRMAVLAALGSVNWVVPFSEETPERLICAIKPDVLVKGGDYQPQEIAGHQCVEANGGQVIVLGFQDGVSTSHIIDAIRRAED